MAKYELKVELTPRQRADGTDNAADEPSLERFAEAVVTGLEVEYGDDFTVRAYDLSRPDRD